MTYEVPDHILLAALGFDPLAVAEQLTGKDYKTDSDTVWTSMPLAMANNAVKAKAFAERHDTHMMGTLEEFLRALAEEGFEKVYELPFVNPKWEMADTLYAFAHPDGILAVLDTYNGRPNSGKVYYAHPAGNKLPWQIMGGGGQAMGSEVYLGNFDIREGMRFRLAALRRYGDFVKPWPEPVFVQMQSHGDYAEDEIAGRRIDLAYSRAQTAARVATFPQWVQDFVRINA